MYSIRVQSSPEFLQVEKPDLFIKNFKTAEEFQPIMDLCDNKRRIGPLEAMVITVRTDTLKNFCKDFFLPTVINHALKYDDMVHKIFIGIIFTAWDVCTFPLRVITIIPRYYYNKARPKEGHLLYQYLINNGVAAADLRADHIYLKLEWLEGRIGLGEFESDLNLATRSETFNFIQLPENESSIRSEIMRKGVPDYTGTLFDPATVIEL